MRISKLGTRPKGGSPKDNCEFEKTQGRLGIGDFLIGSRLDVVDRSQEEECGLKYVMLISKRAGQTLFENVFSIIHNIFTSWLANEDKK